MQLPETSLNILENLKETFRQMIFLLPQVFIFSAIIYLPVFISKAVVFAKTGNISVYGNLASLCGYYLSFFTIYFCGEFVVYRQVSLRDMFAISVLKKFIKTAMGTFLLGIITFVPFAVMGSAFLPKVIVSPTNPIFLTLYALLLSFFMSITILFSSALIWKGLGIFKSFKYLVTLTQSVRLKILASCLFTAIFVVGQTIFNSRFNHVIAELGQVLVFLKFMFDFGTLILLNLFMSLFFVKMFIRLEEINGCPYPLRTEEDIKQSIALEEVAIYQTAN